jgi:hypothetical protein
MRTKPRGKFLLLCGACAFAGCLAVFVVRQGYFSALPHEYRNIREEDRMFLDNLQPKNEDDLVDGNSLAVASGNTDKVGMISAGNEPAPRAELVINTEIVKRAELVVPRGTIKRVERVRSVAVQNRRILTEKR